MKKLLLIALSVLFVGNVNASGYGSEQFRKDYTAVVELATKLKGQCLANKDELACKESKAIVSVLRGFTSKDSDTKGLSKEEQKKLFELMVGALHLGAFDAAEEFSTTK